VVNRRASDRCKGMRGRSAFADLRRARRQRWGCREDLRLA
jgi:hypothetical protein